jgi:sterol desaturase/sphingolipid hydroxylase (fatty acid hydroxylase superfamily)
VQALVFYIVTSRGATLGIWPESWPFAVQVAFALLFADLMFYLTHRALHEIQFLWRFHSIHHSVDKVYWLNSGHFHPIDTALTSAFFIGSLHFLGVPERVLGLFWTINMVHGYLEHANVDFRLGLGNRLWNTPELHQWHHSELIPESNKNYGKVFSVWDSVFRTWYKPVGKRVKRAGLTGDLPEKYNLWSQFMFSFRRKFT